MSDELKLFDGIRKFLRESNICRSSATQACTRLGRIALD